MARREARRKDASVLEKAPYWGDADTGQIIAAELTRKDVDDGSQVGPLLEQIARPVCRLLAMERTIGTTSTVRSASVIPMRRSLDPAHAAELTIERLRERMRAA